MGKNVQKNTKKRLRQTMLRVVVLVTFLAGCTKKEDLLFPQDSTVSCMAESASCQEEKLPSLQEADTEVSSESALLRTDDATILVHVCGAVYAEGVYTLSAEARVSDAVTAAGSFLPEADTSYLNLASKLSDGMQIRIPFLSKESDTSPEGALSQALIPSLAPPITAEGTAGVTLVNINTAGVEELCTLKGIGELRACDIIAYRESNGAFRTIEELMNVNGIGEKLFSGIRDLITV